MRVFFGSLGLAAVLTACDIVDPRPVCACSPPESAFAVMKGDVIDPDGHAVESSRISAHLVGDAPCPALPSALGVPLTTTTGGSGQFRYALGWQSPVVKCWALWASPPSASGLAASDTVLVMVSYSFFPGDSTTTRLQLR